MKIGPRYKKARYLEATVFRKTQTQKYALRSQRKLKSKKGRGGKSEYGTQMLEKQKARYSYGVSGGQFTRYVKRALQSSGDNARNLIYILESRLDNVVVRAGLAPTRSAARQMVSHGHIVVGDTIVTIPSYEVKPHDVITIRKGSVGKVLFSKVHENLESVQAPAWMKIDPREVRITITDKPTVDPQELLFDLRSVLEFYTR